MQSLNLKKIFLYLLIASVALSAVLGIGVIIFGNFGELETKILLTTLTVTVTSILGLACGAFFETRRGKILPVAGILFAVAAAVLWIFLIWNGTVHNDFFVKMLLSITVFAVSCSHLSLLSLARIDRKFIWSYYAAHIAIWSLTAIFLWFIWFTPDSMSEFLIRVVGVLSVIIAALTIVTPIFHKLSRQQNEAEEIDAEIERLESRIAQLKNRRKDIFNNEK